jgi:hypothetical protein
MCISDFNLVFIRIYSYWKNPIKDAKNHPIKDARNPIKDAS